MFPEGSETGGLGVPFHMNVGGWRSQGALEKLPPRMN